MLGLVQKENKMGVLTVAAWDVDSNSMLLRHSYCWWLHWHTNPKAGPNMQVITKLVDTLLYCVSQLIYRHCIIIWSYNLMFNPIHAHPYRHLMLHYIIHCFGALFYTKRESDLYCIFSYVPLHVLFFHT